MPALGQLGNQRLVALRSCLPHRLRVLVTDDVYKMSMNLRNLPTDVLLGILQRLEANDILALRRVSAPSNPRCFELEVELHN